MQGEKPQSRKAGEFLIDEKQHLERAQPELGQAYQSFLKSYAKYRQMERQLEARPGQHRSKPDLAARLRAPR